MGDPRLTFAACGLTDVGRRRQQNEDALLVAPDLGLYVVADGMGGHAGGSTASRLAVETIRDAIAGARAAAPEAFAPEPAGAAGDTLASILRDAVEAASDRIFTEARRDPSLAGMGTTVTAVLVHGASAVLAHVGDSRCYLLRDGAIHQLSEDHSLVNEQMKAGALTREQARHSPLRNVITRSVGFEQQVEVDVLAFALQDGDALLVCCDGLTNLVEDPELLEVVEGASLDDAAARLVALANARGGDDNITVVLIRASAAPRA